MGENEIYNTVGELKKHLGKYVASECARYSNGKLIPTVWIQKLTEIPKEYKDAQKTKGIDVYGDCVTEIMPKQCKIYGYEYDNIEHYRTNAQFFFRKPTKQEMNIYRKFWRQYRILGIMPKTNY